MRNNSRCDSTADDGSNHFFNIFSPNADELRDRWRYQQNGRKNSSTKIAVASCDRIARNICKCAHLRRVAHPTIPTLSWVDERPHRTWSEQVATKCACCQGPSSGQRARAAAVAGRLGSLDECSQRYRGGHDAPPRHTSVMSILAAVIDEIQVGLYV